MSSGVLSQIELFVFEKESLKILLQYKIYCIYIYIGFVKEIEMRETGFYRSLSALLFLELLQYRIMYRSHAKFVCVQICCHEDQRQNQPLGLDDTHTQSETTFRQKSEKARRGKDPTVETTTQPQNLSLMNFIARFGGLSFSHSTWSLPTLFFVQ